MTAAAPGVSITVKATSRCARGKLLNSRRIKPCGFRHEVAADASDPGGLANRVGARPALKERSERDQRPLIPRRKEHP